MRARFSDFGQSMLTAAYVATIPADVTGAKFLGPAVIFPALDVPDPVKERSRRERYRDQLPASLEADQWPKEPEHISFFPSNGGARIVLRLDSLTKRNKRTPSGRERRRLFVIQLADFLTAAANHSIEGQRRQSAGAAPRSFFRVGPVPIRIQSSHAHDERGLDAYFTCAEAVQAFLRLEADHLPFCIWEPAAGDGAIVKPLRKAGHIVFASDIADYGLGGCHIADYLTMPAADGVEGIVTNPPYQLAEEFAKKAIAEVPYVALFVRTNWVMEGTARGKWLDAHPPTREWRSVQRFPMMHRHGWQGPRSTSNTPYAWIVWERGAPQEVARRFYWRELLKEPLEQEAAE